MIQGYLLKITWSQSTTILQAENAEFLSNHLPLCSLHFLLRVCFQLQFITEVTMCFPLHNGLSAG